MTRRGFTLRVDPAPSLSVTVRMFAAESARELGLGDGDIDDLRLLATELLANAVATRSPTLEIEITADPHGWCLRARGAGPLDADPGEPVSRLDVMAGLARIAVTGDGGFELRPLHVS